MASVKFNIISKYKPGKSDEIKTRLADGKSIKSLLNPHEQSIYLFFTIDRDHTFRVKTLHKIMASNWSMSKGWPKPQSADYQTLDKPLSNLTGQVKTLFEVLEKQGATWVKIKVAITELVKHGKLKLDEKSNLTLLEVYNEYVADKRDDVKPLTLKKYNTLRVALDDFQKHTGKVYALDDIDLIWYKKFRHYLRFVRKNRKTAQYGLLDDTFAKYVENFKNFMQWGQMYGYHNNEVYKHKDFSADRKPKLDIVTLNQDEIDALADLDLSNNQRWERVRDLFLFLIFTGQRWGDVHGFRKQDVNNRVWKFIAGKTEKETKIPLIGFAAPAYDVLRKYDFELPKVSDVEFNRIIKKIGEAAGINEPVEKKRFQGKKEIPIHKPKFEFMSSHMGRRTCVTLLLERGTAPTTVLKLTGHTSLKTLQKYDNTGDEALTEAMKTAGKKADLLGALEASGMDLQELADLLASAGYVGRAQMKIAQ